MGWGNGYESLISAWNDFISEVKTEEGSKAKSIFLIMFHSRLIWSVNITHNFNTWEQSVWSGAGKGIFSGRSQAEI